MKNRISILLLTLFLFAVSACTNIDDAKNKKAKPSKTVFNTSQINVEATNEIAVSTSKKVFIPVFRVAFTDDKIKNNTPANKKDKKYQAAINIDNETFKKIADSAYKNFIESLKKNGFEIVDNDTVKDTIAYQAMFKADDGSYIESGAYGKLKFYAPSELEVVILPNESLKAKKGQASPNLANNNNQIPNMMKEFDANALEVNLIIDISKFGFNTEVAADSKKHTSEKLDKIAIKAGSGISVHNRKNLDCTGYCPNFLGNIKISKNVEAFEKKQAVDKKIVEDTKPALFSFFSKEEDNTTDIEKESIQKFERINKEALKKLTTKLVERFNTSFID